MTPMIIGGGSHPDTPQHDYDKFTKEELAEFGKKTRALQKQYPQNNYSRASKKFQIRYYQTNKIRQLLARFYNVGGYPVKFDYHVGYFGGVAMWIQDQWMIMPKLTREGWYKQPFAQWSKVMIMKIDPYDTFQDQLTAKTLTGLVGSLSSLAGKFGVLGGVLTQLYDDAVLRGLLATAKWIDIYPNLLFYNTINDKVIYANWNLIKNDIEQMEETKYLPKFDDLASDYHPFIQ